MKSSLPSDRQALLRTVMLAIVVLACSAASTRTWAHHSFAMFDQHKTTVVSGTVREFQWTNPHVWIQLLVPNPAGGTKEWSIECTSVNFMVRRGWHHDTLKPGDKVTLSIRPLRDGEPGGSFLAVATLNGNPLTLSPE